MNYYCKQFFFSFEQYLCLLLWCHLVFCFCIFLFKQLYVYRQPHRNRSISPNPTRIRWSRILNFFISLQSPNLRGIKVWIWKMNLVIRNVGFFQHFCNFFCGWISNLRIFKSLNFSDHVFFLQEWVIKSCNHRNRVFFQNSSFIYSCGSDYMEKIFIFFDCFYYVLMWYLMLM